jgi:carboxymethylenebutenolidase
MQRKTAADFPPDVLKLFDGYVHGRISRRDFLDRAAKFAVGGVTAAAMLESLRPNYAWAVQVQKEDARIRAEYVTYPSPQGSGTRRGYLGRPGTLRSADNCRASSSSTKIAASTRTSRTSHVDLP